MHGAAVGQMWFEPTVEFRAQMKHGCGDDRWFWRSAELIVPPLREPLGSQGELRAAVRVYGRLAASILEIRKQVLRARVTGHWLPDGGTAVAHYEWRRSGETGRLIPAEEPVVLWIG
ncbi:hypothetical protein BLA24_31980 [Streptomyces cinnamoneus]|uniref:Uncharacterized protein n=1 Tax=Streptomyces cinnamoneus TaxID=53446 RepID=A0A2G1XA17_STRCJ|nr:hypothetical protein BLA24_31980 [Streptomyces cinnamoneus]PPT15694.1 hypothetical protein CYQ11_25035 [Streptomyces cinnamoneus]